jgi:hypothetical protein
MKPSNALCVKSPAIPWIGQWWLTERRAPALRDHEKQGNAELELCAPELRFTGPDHSHFSLQPLPALASYAAILRA